MTEITKNIYNIKIILLGETGVGKTNLINCYFGNKFMRDNLTTISAHQSHQTVNIKNNICYVDIWDTMGQEKFHSVTQSLIKGSHIVIFVYDVTNIKTFEEIDFWVNLAKEEVSVDKTVFGLVGNKLDLYDNIQVGTNEAKEYAKKISAYFSETSAKETPQIFKEFVQKLLEKLFLDENNVEKQGTIIEKSFKKNQSSKKKKKKKKDCC